MSLTRIPVDAEPNQTFQITLTSVTYFIEFKFNQLTSLWSISLLDANRAYIFRGRPVVLGTNLLRATNAQDVPGIILVALANTDDKTDPDFDRLTDGRVSLYYGDSV